MHALNNLTGHVCQVYSIQESIQSLGGLPVLFPLLEQACFKSNAKSKRLFIATDDSLSVKSDVVDESSSNNGDGEGAGDSSEDIDMVDGMKPILSDLPVMYSPRNKTLGNSTRWTDEIDEELGTIEVAAHPTTTDTTLFNSYGDSLDNATTSSVPIPTPASKIKPPLLSKEKKAGSFVVLGTPPIPR